MIANLLQDLRFAFRSLLKRPVFALVAMLCLGLGIGVNTAIYALFDQAVLRPLPVREPDRLVNLSAPGLKQGSTSNDSTGPRDAIFSYPMFRDLQAAPAVQQALTGIAAHRALPASLAMQGQAVSTRALLVSGNYFELLGLQPALGRLLLPDDDATIGGSRVVVLSHRYWQNQLGGDPAVLGRSLRVNGEPLQIVGVAPAGFDGTSFGNGVQAFVPITLNWLLQPTRRKDHDVRLSYWVYLFARLAPGATLEQATDAVNQPYVALLNDVELPLQGDLDEPRRDQFLAGRVILEPGSRGQSSEAENARAPLSLLLAASELVLLVACLNIANLQLAHGAARAGEFALRTSLGASRGRLLRQLFTEALLLAAGGVLLALPLASLSLQGLLGSLPNAGSFAAELSVQPGALAFAGGLAVASVLLFGLFPALQATAISPIQSLRGDGGGNSTGSRAAQRFRSGLAMLQIALAMATLTLAGLFTQSLVNLARVELGLHAESVATFGIAPGRTGYSPQRAAALFDRLQDELAALPGVRAVGLSMVPLLVGHEWGSDVRVEGYTPSPDAPAPLLNYVGEGYFDTLGIPLLRGRDLARSDSADSARVVVVSRKFAEFYGLGENPIGKRMAMGDGDSLDIEIVGVVADSKYSGVKNDEPAQFYLPRRQEPEITETHVYVRAEGDPQLLLQSLRAAVVRLDAELPVVELRTLPQAIASNLATERFVGALAVAFALLATALAALGLYGVLSYTLAQRMRELGLRLALGATPHALHRLLLGQVGRMTAFGIAGGLIAALLLGRAAQSLLFGLDGHDPYVLLAAAVTLSLVALLAGLAPARRAMRIDPMQALRHD